MSVAYNTLVTSIRAQTGDTNSSDYVCSAARLMELVNSRVQMFGSAIGPGTAWLASPIATTPGTGDYAMPTSTSTIQYNQINIVRRGSDHWPLIKRTVQDQAEAWPGASVAQGTPLDYSLWEDDSQVVNIRLRPIPSVADTLEVFYSDLPVLITANETIPFSNPLMAALAKAVACDILAGLLPGQEKKLKVSPAVCDQWNQQVDDALYDEKARINRLKRTQYMQRVDR